MLNRICEKNYEFLLKMMKFLKKNDFLIKKIDGFFIQKNDENFYKIDGFFNLKMVYFLLKND